MVAMDFFAASNCYDFFKSVLFKFAEKSDGERVKDSHIFIGFLYFNLTDSEPSYPVMLKFNKVIL